MPELDPLDGQSITMLNQLLARFWSLAKNGDEKAADRVIKILQLKAQRERTGKPIVDGWRL